ncbi:hypothetical protein B0H11DRAFT_2204411 [Mycena galericulata]|nr:hypothetical protein B0H11DRAFT_2204411 [Mycena galericulata]
MDPLRLTDLPLTENWNLFQPDMKGYIPPQRLQLHEDFEDLESQIRESFDPCYMHDNDVPFMALSVQQPFPTTSLTIRGENFIVPMSSHQMSYLTGTVLGDDHASKNTVPGTQLESISDAGNKTIVEVVDLVLRKIDAFRGDLKTERKLATIDVFKAGSHELSTTPTNENHIATVFVILPSLSTPADIRVQATHAALTGEVRLPLYLIEAIGAIGTYTGVSDGRIDVGAGGEVLCLTYHVFGLGSNKTWVIPSFEDLSGAVPMLRDGFCLWRHSLNSGGGADTLSAPPLMFFFLYHDPKSARDFRGEDATLLCHLAPLAKAYGFTAYIGDIVYTMSTRQELSHPYKEYFGEHVYLDPGNLYMSKSPDVEYELAALRTMGGVNVAEPKLVELATEMVLKDDDYEYLTNMVDPQEDYDILEDGIYSAQIVLRHIRKVSVLFLVA